MVEASGMVAAIEAAWEAIRRRHPDVPAVVVALGAGTVGVPAGRMKLGHYAPHRWTAASDRAGLGSVEAAITSSAGISELFVGGEGLSAGATGVLATLLHEAAHGVAHTRGIKDTSRNGAYHNRRFRDLGEELGLTITQTPPIGWSGTELGPDTATEYAGELDELAAALTAYRYTEADAMAGGPRDPGDGGQADAEEGDGKSKRPKNGVVLVCSCNRKVRTSSSVAELGPIICGVCGSTFEEATS
jgi:hypothetical protein